MDKKFIGKLVGVSAVAGIISGVTSWCVLTGIEKVRHLRWQKRWDEILLENEVRDGKVPDAEWVGGKLPDAEWVDGNITAVPGEQDVITSGYINPNPVPYGYTYVNSVPSSSTTYTPETPVTVSSTTASSDRVHKLIEELGYTSLSSLNPEDIEVVDEDAEEEIQPPNPFDSENNGFGLYRVLDDPEDFGEHLTYKFNTVVLYENGIFTDEHEEVLDDEALRPLIGNTDFLGDARDLWYVDKLKAVYLVNDTIGAYTEVLFEDYPFEVNKEE